MKIFLLALFVVILGVLLMTVLPGIGQSPAATNPTDFQLRRELQSEVERLREHSIAHAARLAKDKKDLIEALKQLVFECDRVNRNLRDLHTQLTDSSSPVTSSIDPAVLSICEETSAELDKIRAALNAQLL